MSPIRVLLADGSPAFRRAASQYLSTAAGIEVVGAAGSGGEALEKAAALRPDVVLMGLISPLSDAEVTIARLKGLSTAPRVVIVTDLEGDAYRTWAERIPVDGFVGKDSFCKEIIAAVSRLFG